MVYAHFQFELLYCLLISFSFLTTEKDQTLMSKYQSNLLTRVHIPTASNPGEGKYSGTKKQCGRLGRAPC